MCTSCTKWGPNKAGKQNLSILILRLLQARDLVISQKRKFMSVLISYANLKQKSYNIFPISNYLPYLGIPAWYQQACRNVSSSIWLRSKPIRDSNLKIQNNTIHQHRHTAKTHTFGPLFYKLFTFKIEHGLYSLLF